MLGSGQASAQGPAACSGLNRDRRHVAPQPPLRAPHTQVVAWRGTGYKVGSQERMMTVTNADNDCTLLLIHIIPGMSA